MCRIKCKNNVPLTTISTSISPSRGSSTMKQSTARTTKIRKLLSIPLAIKMHILPIRLNLREPQPIMLNSVPKRVKIIPLLQLSTKESKYPFRVPPPIRLNINHSKSSVILVLILLPIPINKKISTLKARAITKQYSIKLFIELSTLRSISLAALPSSRSPSKTSQMLPRKNSSQLQR